MPIFLVAVDELIVRVHVNGHCFTNHVHVKGFDSFPKAMLAGTGVGLPD
jgi:hypothetical protein